MPDEPRHPLELEPDDLRWQCDPGSLEFETTADVPPCADIIGQERALKAIRLGLSVDRPGYNLFITGLTGTGRTTTVKCLIEQMDRSQAPPDDLIYLHNFKDPDKPRAVALEAGHGRRFRAAMAEMVKNLKSAIPEVFETEEYQRRTKEMIERYREQERTLTRALEREVEDERFQLVQIQLGSVTRTDILPLIDGKPMAFDELEAKVDREEFPRRKFDDLQQRYETLTASLQDTLKGVKKLQRDFKQESRELDNNMIRPVVEQIVGEVEQDDGHAELVDYLAEVTDHILDEPDAFRRSEAPTPPLPVLQAGGDDDDPFAVYQVNLLVDNSETEGAPVIVETSPSYKNVFGTIERLWDRHGAVRPNFMSIKAGSFLRASGGFLLVNAFDMLSEPFVWPVLKRTLRNGVVDIEALETFFLSTSGLKPESIPAKTKVILIGERWIHQLMWAVDPDFRKIFKVRSEFDKVMKREDGRQQSYVRLISKMIQDEELMPFRRDGVAAVLEQATRMAGRRGKLTTEFNALVDVLREADFLAREEGAELVTREHVLAVSDERRERLGLLEDKILELVDDGALLIDTGGRKVGQVNGLAVLSAGDYVFGKPSRITAAVGLGRAGLVNIEREANLSGSTHNKGVLILGGFLADRFARDKPLTLSAHLAFEQSYEGVDGDSASSTELYAVLSALAELPLRQDLAVTGSVNQRGEVQVIGGVNYKVEGFFDVCRLGEGLTGSQGVLIPNGNQKDLMLRTDVVEAVRAGRFHIYAVDHVDQGIELLTGVAAGARGDDGEFPEGTVNRRVDDRLREMATTLARFARSAGDDKPAESESNANGD